jgi:hypothetical protein
MLFRPMPRFVIVEGLENVVPFRVKREERPVKAFIVGKR